MTKVLIVDDEPEVARVLERILKFNGFEVIRAQNGQTALELFLNNRDSIDLVLLDKRMPGMGGDEILSAIRAVDRKVPIIMLSGLVDQQEREESLKLGCTDFLTKPIELQQLIDQINRILSG